jgi:hypothetical protein
MLRIDIHRWFAMMAILNPKWPPHFESKMAAKIKKSSDLEEI